MGRALGRRGRPGPWCFNNSLLEDAAYIGLMTRCFWDWSAHVEFVEDPWTWWGSSAAVRLSASGGLGRGRPASVSHNASVCSTGRTEMGSGGSEPDRVRPQTDEWSQVRSCTGQQPDWCLGASPPHQRTVFFPGPPPVHHPCD